MPYLEDLINHLSQFITDNKRKKMEEVLENRTRHIAVVVEDIYQPHNASAVIRSCDCFGIQELHVIENKNKYKVNPDVTLGSSKWVDIIQHGHEANNSIACINSLKERGYKIVVTTPHTNDLDLENFPIDEKMAVFLGNEVEGVSKEAINNADAFLKIPMFGFTESLNISVTAAICMHHLTLKLRQSHVNWRLTEGEKMEIKLRWIKNIVKKSELIEQDFLNSRGNQDS